MQNNALPSGAQWSRAANSGNTSKAISRTESCGCWSWTTGKISGANWCLEILWDQWSACRGKISDGFSPAVRKGRHHRLLQIFCEMMHDVVFTVQHKHMYPNTVLQDLLKTWAANKSIHVTCRWGNAFNPEGQKSPLFVDSNKLLGVSKYELMKLEQAESQREQVTTHTKDSFLYSLLSRWWICTAEWHSLAPGSPITHSDHTAEYNWHCLGWKWDMGRAQDSADSVMADNGV